MGSKSLVSIIIIFLNAEKFLGEAIESIYSQTYGNWELLLVDDGSTDTSTEIALRHAAQNPGKVYYLEHPGHQNRGMSASRNLGIRKARGDLIAFLDADDVWLTQKLEQQVTLLISHPQAGMIYGKTQYWFSWTGLPGDNVRDYEQGHGIEADNLIKPPWLLKLFLRGEAAFPPPSSILVWRKHTQEVGGFEESFRGMYEDQAFYAKFCLNHSVFVADKCWDRYRQHLDSACNMAERAGQSEIARLNFLNWLEAYLIKQGCIDRGLWQAIGKEHWRMQHPILARLERSVRRFERRIIG